MKLKIWLTEGSYCADDGPHFLARLYEINLFDCSNSDYNTDYNTPKPVVLLTNLTGGGGGRGRTHLAPVDDH